MRKVITYGTFDTLHFGHIRLLERAKNLGDFLIVGLSTDAFNSEKGKRSHFSFDERRLILDSIKHVDLIIPEKSWDQKPEDLKAYNVDVFTMGDDWAGEFDYLRDYCEVKYLDRTPSISSSLIKSNLKTPKAESA